MNFIQRFRCEYLTNIASNPEKHSTLCAFIQKKKERKTTKFKRINGTCTQQQSNKNQKKEGKKNMSLIPCGV